MSCISLKSASLTITVSFLSVEVILILLKYRWLLVNLSFFYVVFSQIHHVREVLACSKEFACVFLEHTRSVWDINSEKAFVVSLISSAGLGFDLSKRNGFTWQGTGILNCFVSYLGDVFTLHIIIVSVVLFKLFLFVFSQVTELAWG